jgi:hypothetical protein
MHKRKISNFKMYGLNNSLHTCIYHKNIICILHFNIYFKQYILKLITLHLSIGSKKVCNASFVMHLSADGHKYGRNM